MPERGTPMPKAAPVAMTDLKLIALDEEDLAVVSSLLQDAVVRVADMTYVPSQKRFAPARAQRRTTRRRRSDSTVCSARN